MSMEALALDASFVLKKFKRPIVTMNGDDVLFGNAATIRMTSRAEFAGRRIRVAFSVTGTRGT
jgi:hypothetical protein